MTDEVLRRNAVLPQNRIGETSTEHEVNFVCMCEEFIGLIYYGTSLLFIVIGNYLPKIKQNNTIGIRIVLTLQDEENWNATHRFSGKLWMASGILCMLCGLFGESMAALVVYIISIMAAAIISILYSYLFIRKSWQPEKA